MSNPLNIEQVTISSPPSAYIAFAEAQIEALARIEIVIHERHDVSAGMRNLTSPAKSC